MKNFIEKLNDKSGMTNLKTNPRTSMHVTKTTNTMFGKIQKELKEKFGIDVPKGQIAHAAGSIVNLKDVDIAYIKLKEENHRLQDTLNQAISRIHQQNQKIIALQKK